MIAVALKRQWSLSGNNSSSLRVQVGRRTEDSITTDGRDDPSHRWDLAHRRLSILSCVFTGMGMSLHRVCLVLPFHFGTMPSSLWKTMARNRLIAMARMISMALGQERQE
jgi:hypothetical protein